jgi:hypothetical protein
MAQVRNGPAVSASGPFAFARLKWFASIALASLAALTPAAAQAWGNQGHRITALFADTLLTPRTRAQVQELTGALSLADLANWADENRSGLTLLIDNSDRWHYDNRPVCDAAARIVSYCPNGDCASAALTRFEATLADAAATRDQRAIALRFLVHVLGDIHQPLHVGDNGDEGGNKRNVALGPEKPRNLHSYWDSGFLQQMLRGSSEQAFAAGLREFYQDDITDWQQGSERDWMNESFVILQQRTYGDLPRFRCGAASALVTPLPDDYAREARSQIGRQLARAGARIASTLNRLLDVD